MSVSVLNFGCRLNGAEGETVKGLAEAAGLSDVVVVNTCAVTAEAGRQAARAIRRARREHPQARIVATGCAVEIEPARFAAMPEVANLVGNAEKMRAGIWADLGAGALPRAAMGGLAQLRDAPAPASDAGAGRVRAFVEVQNGCDHSCTFCTIPAGRGRSRSVPVPAVIEAIGVAVAGGAREVVLTGVDITAYGQDLPRPTRLGGLVKAILSAVPELPRLRLSSIDSVEADDDLLDALATEPRLMPHLHLSLQAGDDLVLKRMKRRHARADAIAFCEALRRARPGIVFGADLIAGFPTESEAMFARSLDLVEECGLTYLHVFPYSARPGTPAARMPVVAETVIRERAARLREAGAASVTRHLAAEVGQRRRVLVEGNGMGRTETFAPVSFASAPPRGTLADTMIRGHDARALLA
ncbi:tRNA (N(6)-L-threonylcarbamoyladenosine(37)-C(2))-methylthiotransferase MtaB [Enterovirga rhinocerotis]|uniref:Threonylcarbamoyladenosine tRNA methylthiotransferase MtaB n=1 Tax=Enterovirga rhinocerotis TaxID=1339210 RepID=A0A4R7BYP8_9HYPH|nr:tRNA (N(6)-L-threonylcarbamoyladenosine(37)-C(2))-methylthiotransferase MtaB [Enterovirga rhinocerotis]TDR90382.1 threonylcarbamoyladenosine tRNA methylthiotransferase MtaB [Enterovirga rhinocerotis]